MRIDTNLMDKTIKELREREDYEISTQPSMVLGCYIGLKLDDDSYCLKCRTYRFCESYLRAFQIKEVLFER